MRDDHRVALPLVSGSAAAALEHYRVIFGGELTLHTFAEFDRRDGPGGAIAHGIFSGPVTLYATDAADGEETVSTTGVSIALLGTADGPTLTRWFDALGGGGQVVDPLQKRKWGARRTSGRSVRNPLADRLR